MSTELEMQEGSYELQVKYYTDLIKGNRDMEFVGVYGDRGKSGLSKEGRPGLQSLLADCKAGKIDFILTKSISRFARSMGDCAGMVRELRSYGVSVYFEKENLNTEDTSCDFILNILSAIAEEESHSISQHIIQSYEQKSKEGRPYGSVSYGYYSLGNSRWVINGSQAKRVKKAFDMALAGETYTEIVNALNEMEETPFWRQDRVRFMLTNIAYKGDIYTHKYVSLVPGKSVPNKGYRNRYYIKGHHEPLVSPEDFEKVQKIEKRGLLRSNKRRTEDDIEFLKGVQNGIC